MVPTRSGCAADQSWISGDDYAECESTCSSCRFGLPPTVLLVNRYSHCTRVSIFTAHASFAFSASLPGFISFGYVSVSGDHCVVDMRPGQLAEYLDAHISGRDAPWTRNWTSVKANIDYRGTQNTGKILVLWITQPPSQAIALLAAVGSCHITAACSYRLNWVHAPLQPLD